MVDGKWKGFLFVLVDRYVYISSQLMVGKLFSCLLVYLYALGVDPDIPKLSVAYKTYRLVFVTIPSRV